MSLYVNLAVLFPCDHNEPVAALARRHLNEADIDGTADDECMFLTHLAERRGENPGRKGGMTTWGMIGNYSDGARFARNLEAFWLDLLHQPDAGPDRSERIVVLWQSEHEDTANAVEISLIRGGRALQIVEHALPLGWG